MSFIRSSEPPADPEGHEEKQEEDQTQHSRETAQSQSPPRSNPHTPHIRGTTPESTHDPNTILGARPLQADDKKTAAQSASTFDVDLPEAAVSSSDDEIIFAGRKARSRTRANKAEDCSGDSQVLAAEQPQADRGKPATNSLNDSHDFVSLHAEPARSRKGKERTSDPTKKRKRPKSRRPDVSGSESGVQAALDDYLANARENGDFEGMQVDMAGYGREEGSFEDTDMHGWATEDLQDFDEMSTSEEILETVSYVLSKRHRPSGLQYLVVWEEQSIDEARWIPHISLPHSATQLINEFEEEEKQIREYQSRDNEDSDSEDSEAEDDGAEEDGSEASFAIDWGSDENIDENEVLDDDDFNDEHDLIQRRKERMTDEHIARLLQKQESLGIYDNDLALFDGAEDLELSDDLLDKTPVKSTRKRSQRRSKARSTMPSFFNEEDELLLAGEDYGGFDVMDRERASLSFRSKGKKPDAFELQLSDSDMADELRDAWATDRKKKKAKKAEREELRAQGLLGKKVANKGRPDLKVRYGEGMSMSNIEQEFENFLFNGQSAQMALPSMDKRDRKIIHDISSAFGLKSKSQGSGKRRFPVIFKTNRTIEFDDAIFEKLRGQLNRRFFPRMDTKSKQGGPRGPRTFKKSGGGFGNSFGYREGDVVGAGASEIGQENRGRAMLEKMGWSKGNTLGALGSQGLLTPIEHIVKNSKAGLG